jgi:hypothetical protein
MNLDALQQILQIASSITSLLGIPIGIYVYYSTKRKEQHDREYGTYNALDEKYIDYLLLCLQNWDLDVFDVPLESKKKATAEQTRKEAILFSILTSIFERAYLMYEDQSNEIKKAQFTGWEHFMRDWSARANFRRAWKQAGFDPETYDQGFYKFMNSMIEAHEEPADETKTPSSL